MRVGDIYKQLNFIKQCQQYNLPLWQCPGFLTVVMGIVTIVFMIGTYFIANRYSEEPEMAALVVIVTTFIIFVIGYLIVRSFSYLAEANQMKSEFVSITTHQLRTPLASVKWSLNLLLDEKLCQIDSKQKEYLDIMRISNERMIKLVNDLLDVSRVEQKSLDLKPQKFSLADLVQSLVLELSPIAQSRNIALEVKKENALPQVCADLERIRMAVQNILDNAFKYTEDKGEIEVKIGRRGKYLKCEVSDNGVGIPEHQKDKIFQKFFRSENVKKYQTEGTGLGLFIAKAIVEASGGKIGFSSREGQGSTFWFTIPIIN